MKLTDDRKDLQENEEGAMEEDSEDENISTEKTDKEFKDHSRPIRRLCIPWLVRKMVREANHEAIKNYKVTLKVSYKIFLVY